MRRTVILTMLVFMLSAQFSWAQIPETMSYQGLLTDASGTPLNGSYNLTFRLYESDSGGTALWAETHPSVEVVNGVCSVILGKGDPGNPLNLDFDQQYWLGVTIGGEELQPLIPLTSTAYSLGGNFWKLGGNGMTDPSTNFLGTTDNQPLELRVNDFRILRFEYDPISPNVIAGYKDNSLLSGVFGATICGGGKYNNTNYVTDIYGTIGGGIDNQAGDNTGALDSAEYATVSGGIGNIASGPKSTVGGGAFNMASGLGATVPGGIGNMAKGDYSFAAGRGSEAEHKGCFVWSDTLLEDFSSTGDNQFLVRAIGGVEIESYGGSLRLEPHTTCMNVIGGNWRNSVTPDVYGATICGGGERDEENTVTDHYGTIGGGRYNQAGDDDEDLEDARYATVSGGWSNNATFRFATVGGGRNNTANDDSATVAGGYGNTSNDNYASVGGGGLNEATGWYSTVPGGYSNKTNGWCSFAAGLKANANKHGAFVWADASDRPDGTEFTSLVDNEFAVRCTGGARFVTAIDGSGNPTKWAYLAPNTDQWQPGISSDRNLKTGFAPVDGLDILQRLVSIPVETWSYNGDDLSVRHIGPMAQDFHRAFGLGYDDKSINSLDADGVALAAIQGLYQIVKEKEAENTALQRRVDDLEARLKAVEELVSGIRGQSR